MKPLDTISRPLRADAARNREKVMAAARKTFAEEGLDAEMSAIAKKAGVGVGTVYRHFPAKADLLEALREDHFAKLAEIVEGVEAENLGPWESVETLVWRTAEYTADDRAMSEVLVEAPVGPGVERPSGDRLRAASGRLVERAVQAGEIRPDATIDDIPMMMCAFGRVATMQRCGAPVDWRRYLTVMLAGLRAP